MCLTHEQLLQCAIVLGIVNWTRDKIDMLDRNLCHVWSTPAEDKCRSFIHEKTC